MKQNKSLFEELKIYNEKGIYPLHMPGHKRRMTLSETSESCCFPDVIREKTFGNPMTYDFTEVSGTDDLHHPEGILLESMKRTAEVFGADKTRFLVNGSTSGNLIGISAICPLNGELIVARNCHRSVFHALEIRNITPHWLYPQYDEEFGILTDIDACQVEKLLEDYPESRGVVITSPTYEGVVSDIEAIADICHRHGIPLFVDEAHGAHFGLVESAGFPKSAIQCGADIAVQSAHKTLIGMTQTAFLHIKSDLVNEDTVDRFIDIYETSSPSYPLMISLDSCTEMILDSGEAVFSKWSGMLKRFDEKVRGLKHFKVMCHGRDNSSKHVFYDFDKSKLLVNCRDTHLDGGSLMKIMRDRFSFELEMSLSDNGLAMTGPGDEPGEILRFADAILELDREEELISEAGKENRCLGELSSKVLSERDMEMREEAVDNIDDRLDKSHDSNVDFRDRHGFNGHTDAYHELLSTKMEQSLTLQEATESSSECFSFPDAAGNISAEYIYCYPPGIPMVVPGEILTEKCIEMLGRMCDMGCKLHYTKSVEDTRDIMCVKKS
ncbi:aminotransferase class I/II-fold pyridoxal phosphate-dependent enzyme [Oribacterium sp. WCC10]|uniref:aminotransferase class I/II-fold pyridoxal phosphate-dependent enzyme n=1 Tax=Oribacterium sp. WCC10 TaxID=1855343 RepID=UPI0008F410A1|nr:aminotransferase class V-fold PLP-dependent enzyme [Oribacterium sp. WCC10]SFG37982.1 Arginine/lysine/ornithine decarboxylase [Oribacterium sp. WCC10]